MNDALLRATRERWISSLEHAGLGRDGDPVDPEADLAAMARLARLLGPDGRLGFAMPVGAGAMVWNAQRIDGGRRRPKPVVD
ncbi:MAG: DUF268 domain-containing protein [Polyangiales bacterium]